MGFFETYFDVQGDGEHKVRCPFPHVKSNGEEYNDHVPSMSVNLNKRVYKCQACGASGNEINMVRELFHTTVPKATKFVNMLAHEASVEDVANQWTAPDDEASKYLQELGIDPDIMYNLLAECEKVQDHFEIGLPVTYKDSVVDVRTYRQGCTPKVLSEPGAPVGLIVPETVIGAEKWVFLCAGEKDMLVARSNKLNACTLTGGELATPLNPEWFKDMKVAICYDNDQAGRNGAYRVATNIAPYAKDVRIITKFHEDFPEIDSKEDITDWFTKYGHTAKELCQYVADTESYEVKEQDDDEYPLITLEQAVSPEHNNDIVRTNVQILTVSDSVYRIPKEATLMKMGCVGRDDTLQEGESVLWSLEEHITDVYKMIGKPASKQREIATLDTLHKMEKGLGMQVQEYSNIYICQIADINSSYKNMTELTAYFIDEKPAQGGKYEVTYKVGTDPERSVVGALVVGMKEATDDIAAFTLDVDTRSALTFAAHQEGTVEDRVNHRAEAVRGLLGYECDVDLIKTIDLSYNTVKAFNYGSNKNVRGYMDTLVIGESRVGKSDTAQTLMKHYGVGAFTSLAGSAATLAGLVGGSVKDSVGRLSTRAGVIPRNNEGLIVFEELAKAPSEILKSMTDVRSSGLARITRVSGSIEMPASLRMITLSNCKPMSDGYTRAIKEYSSGLDVVKDLIGTAEDIARYDLIYLADDAGESDPLYCAPEAYPDDVLQACIRWTWSRTAEQIRFVDNSDVLIRDRAAELNRQFPLHIKLFGTECWKKLARLAIATAAYVVSTDETMENILVTPECVEYAAKFLRSVYDNDTFKLQIECEFKKLREEPNEGDTLLLQSFYIKYKIALTKLYQLSRMDKGSFKDLAGITTEDFAPLMRVLVGHDFVTVDRSNMYTTMKYKNTFRILQKETEVERVH